MMEEPINTPISSPKSSSDKVFKISLIIIGFLIVIGLFINAYLLLKKPKPTKVSAPIPTATPTSLTVFPTSIPTSSETTNWKEYRNDKYGFSFKYPMDYLIEITDNQSSVDLYSTASKENRVFGLGIYLNSKKLDLEEFYTELEKNNQSGDPISPFNQTGSVIKKLSDGKPIYFFRNVYCVTSCDKAIFKDDNNVYEFINYIPAQNKLFDQILSTFKFLP